jgi:hypothetical protein
MKWHFKFSVLRWITTALILLHFVYGWNRFETLVLLALLALMGFDFTVKWSGEK